MNELVRFALAAFFPRVEDLPGVAELELDAQISQLRRESTLLFWTGLVAASVFFQLSPVLTVRRPWPAYFLTEEQLDAHANGIASYPLYLVRQIIVLLKLVGGLFWGQSREVRAFIALPPYEPDPGTRRMAPQIARFASTAARAPVPALVQLGRREEARGRVDGPHELEIGKVA